jgi:RNA polymerase sigma-70 factor (ECF subfamily)
MDHERFISLFLRHQNELQAFVLSVVRDWDRAQDIIQDAALVLWRRADSYDPNYSFGAWARGICAKMLLKNRVRERRARQLAPEAVAAIVEAFDASEQQAPRVEALRGCVARLGEGARDLLHWRYRDGLPVAEIAQRSERTVPAVSQALLRLRAALERCIRAGLAKADHA